ncbi:Aste57867_24577 [Aphanomyces stellatus]|uniref:Aste57867_24577 protein n=1 Tax=Aphanomyces stellatus TaxID=120398 RepID=A0A485LQZ1_9STRA|nr:hypothetical protein As57867_024499 [Aphanomyces stellatus]VFU01216.1 Aste57867_24577 [Aphanomyces stellatus]
MSSLPPQWVVCGPAGTDTHAQCEILKERHGVILVSMDELRPTAAHDEPDSADETDDEAGVRLLHALFMRLREDDCKTHGWVLDNVPQTHAQAKALVHEGMRPHLALELQVPTAPLPFSLRDALSCPVATIDGTQSRDDMAAAIDRAIDAPDWISRLSALPCLQEHPGALGDLIQVAATLPTDKQSAAINLFVSFLQNEPHAFVLDDPSSTMLAMDLYTRVSKPTQAVVAAALTPELQAMLPLVEKLPTQALVTMAPLAQELLQESQAGAINPATAVRVHTAFFDLPEKERKQLIRALPPNEKELVTHVVETTEGLSPRDVATVVTMLLQTQRPMPPPSSSSATTPASSSSSLPPLHPRAHDPTYGTIEMPEPLSRDTVVAKLALTATKAHGRRLLRWVQSAPTSLRVLSFLASILLVTTSFVAFWLDLFSGHVFLVIINAWVLFFALLLVSLEVKIMAVEKHVSTYIVAHFSLLATVSGRGAFLVFVGMLAMSLVAKATWQNALLCAAGGLSLLVGLWSISLGALAFHQFNLLRTRIESVAELTRIFNAVDTDGLGELDLDGLHRFCLYFHWPIDNYFLETILRDLDVDNSNALSLSDLQIWWAQTQVDTTVSVQMSRKTGLKPTSGLKWINVLAGVLTVATGVTGNVATLHDRTQTFGTETIYVVLNLWVMAFGLLVIVLEAPPYWFHLLTACKLFVTENFARFLDTIFGRSLFYFFVGTFTISVYQNDGMVLPLVVGAGLLVLAMINTAVGKQAKTRFLAIANAVNVSNCPRLFADADADGDGVWSFSELERFCVDYCHVQLSAAQWELLVADMDRDHLGVISLHEFTTWVQLQHKNMDLV